MIWQNVTERGGEGTQVEGEHNTLLPPAQGDITST